MCFGCLAGVWKSCIHSLGQLLVDNSKRRHIKQILHLPHVQRLVMRRRVLLQHKKQQDFSVYRIRHCSFELCHGFPCISCPPLHSPVPKSQFTGPIKRKHHSRIVFLHVVLLSNARVFGQRRLSGHLDRTAEANRSVQFSTGFDGGNDPAKRPFAGHRRRKHDFTLGYCSRFKSRVQRFLPFVFIVKMTRQRDISAILESANKLFVSVLVVQRRHVDGVRRSRHSSDTGQSPDGLRTKFENGSFRRCFCHVYLSFLFSGRPRCVLMLQPQFYDFPVCPDFFFIQFRLFFPNVHGRSPCAFERFDNLPCQGFHAFVRLVQDIDFHFRVETAYPSGKRIVLCCPS
nr:MAG TPA: hypothetical protein [Bacteriophage sp.]